MFKSSFVYFQNLGMILDIFSGFSCILVVADVEDDEFSSVNMFMLPLRLAIHFKLGRNRRYIFTHFSLEWISLILNFHELFYIWRENWTKQLNAERKRVKRVE